MKKSLIALAVLAASSAAMAQSTVTLYGVADAYVGQTSTTIAGVKLKQTEVGSGGFNGSRWGLKGSEDLGGGLKAIFTLESGFDLSTGKSEQDNTLFGRQAFVGVQGNFGAVTLGRQYTAYDELRGATNQAYDTLFATTVGVWGSGIADYSDRVNNSIAYASPSFGGISGALVVGTDENKTAGLSATKNVSAHIKYANGPLVVGYAHQVQDSRIAATTAPVAAAFNDQKIKYNLIAGSYDFGVAALTGGYNDVKQGSANDKEVQVGVSVPFGAASVAVGYAHSKNEAANGVTTKSEGYSLTGLYDLSKRTRLYAGLNNVKQKESSDKNSIFAVGVRHAF